jgi:mono/diheme cytochrome c family protein
MSLVSLACADGDRDLPRQYRTLDVPTALLASKDAQRHGRALYLESCALCHGDRGDGRGLRREGFVRPPRDFTDPAWRRSTSPRRVFAAIREGVEGTPMPAWTHLSDDDVWSVTSYVLSLGEPR